MRRSENEREASRKKRRKGAQFLNKKKENITITAKRDISLENADYLKLITRKSTIPRRKENEKFKKSLN
jgi:hypothetical protein